jgi:Zn-dependent protease with chaperone function
MRLAIGQLTAPMPLLLVAAIAFAAGPTGISAVVHKSAVDVHAAPDFKAPSVARLSQNAAVHIAAQQGLWYQLSLDDGRTGYVRVNDVRVAHAGVAKPGENARAMFTGKAGKGRVSETAGVRGIDESDLRGASFNATELAKLESYRATPEAALAHARANHWEATQVAYAGEGRATGGNTTQADAPRKRSGAGSLLSSIGRGALGSLIGVSEKAIPKGERELAEEELEFGPQIAGRVLGAAPLWDDAAVQQRVNLVGRWMASQTSRPELPWTFGVVDSPEINAFAAPGGYVLVTRGLYELIGSDAELAAILGHEINHIVQRDHYQVIRKQELQSAGQDLVSSNVSTGGGVAGSLARGYVEKHGAAIMATSLDREAEYRSDEAAQVYLARSGANPLALYAVLQKMAATGSASSGLAQLYKTHPPLDERLDRIDRRGDGALQAYTSRE